jgi:peptidoglycan hydrolase-like protein with peptidoglycan-binding domain
VTGELTGDEPDLELGAGGEGVLLLQVRLYRLGIYRQLPDSTYDLATENAVRDLQSQAGIDNTGEVNWATWEAIVRLEQQYGVPYQFNSPYDALAQLRYDLEHPGGASGEFPAGDPALSDDGQWRWDGSQWQAAVDEHVGSLSEDGQWRWDGSQWQAAVDEHVGPLSEDGQWRWDGSQWRAT